MFMLAKSQVINFSFGRRYCYLKIFWKRVKGYLLTKPVPDYTTFLYLFTIIFVQLSVIFRYNFLKYLTHFNIFLTICSMVKVCVVLHLSGLEGLTIAPTMCLPLEPFDIELQANSNCLQQSVSQSVVLVAVLLLGFDITSSVI